MEGSEKKFFEGKVKWFSKKRGYGFISFENEVDFFFHVTSVVGPELPDKGDIVRFNVFVGEKGKYAGNVIIVENNIPPKLKEAMRDDEDVVDTYPVGALHVRKGVYGEVDQLKGEVFGIKKRLKQGLYVLTTKNIYDYWLTDGENFIDLPLQKITNVEYFKLKKLNPLKRYSYSDDIKRYTSRYDVPDPKYLELGVLKSSTTWESSIVFPDPSQARTIIKSIKDLLERFWPEPISISEKNQELYFSLSLDIPHKKVTKVEFNSKEKDKPKTDRDVQKRLQHLKELYEKGLITTEDYEKKRNDILNEL